MPNNFHSLVLIVSLGSIIDMMLASGELIVQQRKQSIDEWK